MAYNPRDHYFKKAKKENFAARSIYKLQEIDQRFRLFKSGQQVLDLGAAPGSWSQYVSPKILPAGTLLGIDLQPIAVKLPNAHFFVGDINDFDFQAQVEALALKPEFDVVLSDMAPKTTGIKVTDQARSLDLCEMALKTAEKFLRPGGSFVCKFFHSEDFKGLKTQIQQKFDRVEALKPESTRSVSKEIFLIGLGRRR